MGPCYNKPYCALFLGGCCSLVVVAVGEPTDTAPHTVHTTPLTAAIPGGEGRSSYVAGISVAMNNEEFMDDLHAGGDDMHGWS
jgi:hypothetical protein